jgi:hypothetical protein
MTSESDASRRDDANRRDDASRRDKASARAELAALADAVEACRARLTDLAERRRSAARGKDDEADSLLVSIYEAERGLSSAIRLLQRAVRTAR